MPNKPRFEASEDMLKCCDYLRKHKTITYRELSQYLGRDVQRRDRYVLENARRRLEGEGVVFVVETGVGLHRANDKQISTLATEQPVGRIRRVVKRAKEREKIVNIQNLSNEDRIAHYIGTAVLGAVDQSTRQAFKREVKRAIAEHKDGGPLDLSQTLDLFNRIRFNSKGRR